MWSCSNGEVAFFGSLSVEVNKKELLVWSNSYLLRYLADSNRRTRFCRPLPSHSAKVPLWFADAKVVLIFGLANLYAAFFAVFGYFVVFAPFCCCLSTATPTRGTFADLAQRAVGLGAGVALGLTLLGT